MFSYYTNNINWYCWRGYMYGRWQEVRKSG